MDERDLHSRSTLSLLLAILGLVGTGLGSAALLTEMGPGTGVIVAGILVFLVGIVWRVSPLVRVKDEHLEIRPMPLSARRYVRFKDIIAMRSKAKEIELVVRRRGKAAERMKLDLSGVDPRRMEHFVSWLRRRVPRPEVAPLESIGRTG